MKQSFATIELMKVDEILRAIKYLHIGVSNVQDINQKYQAFNATEKIIFQERIASNSNLLVVMLEKNLFDLDTKEKIVANIQSDNAKEFLQYDKEKILKLINISSTDDNQTYFRYNEKNNLAIFDMTNKIINRISETSNRKSNLLKSVLVEIAINYVQKYDDFDQLILQNKVRYPIFNTLMIVNAISVFGIHILFKSQELKRKKSLNPKKTFQAELIKGLYLMCNKEIVEILKPVVEAKLKNNQTIQMEDKILKENPLQESYLDFKELKRNFPNLKTTIVEIEEILKQEIVDTSKISSFLKDFEKIEDKKSLKEFEPEMLKILEDLKNTLQEGLSLKEENQAAAAKIFLAKYKK